MKQTFDRADMILATIVRNGIMVARLAISGVASHRELMQQLVQKLGRMSGLLTVRLRNVSAGWSSSNSVVLSAR